MISNIQEQSDHDSPSPLFLTSEELKFKVLANDHSKVRKPITHFKCNWNRHSVSSSNSYWHHAHNHHICIYITQNKNCICIQNIITMLTSSCCRVHLMCCRITLLMSISPHNCHCWCLHSIAELSELDMQSVQALQANKLNLLHDVLSCIGEQGTEALVRYINENSVENHHHYNGWSLPYSKGLHCMKICWIPKWKLTGTYWPISGYTWLTTDNHTFSIPAMLSCCHKYARKPENRDTPVQQNQRDQLCDTCKKCNNEKKQKLKACQNPWSATWLCQPLTTKASSWNRGFLSLQLQCHSHHLQTCTTIKSPVT